MRIEEHPTLQKSQGWGTRRRLPSRPRFTRAVAVLSADSFAVSPSIVLDSVRICVYPGNINAEIASLNRCSIIRRNYPTWYVNDIVFTNSNPSFVLNLA